jgi:hypothetical protein
LSDLCSGAWNKTVGDAANADTTTAFNADSSYTGRRERALMLRMHVDHRN